MTQKQHPRVREQPQALRERPHADVLIIGGGINGIATFRELALQGVDVALVEQGDFVSGASSASSHMVHGGIRYLENGEFRLVKEAVTERNRLLRTAPHYVRPLMTTIPIFKTFSGILTAPIRLLITHGRGRPRERGALLIRLGLAIYDTFSRGGGRVPRSKFLGKQQSLEELPRLTRRIKYTATYYDASMHDPERLALDVLNDALVAGRGCARASNYVAAVGSADGSVRLRDDVSGEEFDFTARVILNTSGPWTDLTNDALGTPTKHMGGTKGSHIVLDNPELLAATAGRELFFEHSDGRIVLIYPLKHRVMVGTTDINADPRNQPVCTDDEVEYFFSLVKQIFPDIHIHRSQIIYTFSGIRPLPRHDDTAPGFVSRDYRIVRSGLGSTPLLSLVGGKWTTFRASAEHLADRALSLLGRKRKVSTTDTPIGGGIGFPRDEAAHTLWVARYGGNVDSSVVTRLLHRYGTRAAEVLAAIPPEPRELTHTPGYYSEELAHLARTEDVVHLDDLLLRRTSIAFVGGITDAGLREIAEVVAAALGWDDAKTDEECGRTTVLLRESHRVTVGTPGLAPLDTKDAS